MKEKFEGLVPKLHTGSLVPSFPSLAERGSESGPSIFSHIGEDRIKGMVEKILIVLGRIKPRYQVIYNRY